MLYVRMFRGPWSRCDACNTRCVHSHPDTAIVIAHALGALELQIYATPSAQMQPFRDAAALACIIFWPWPDRPVPTNKGLICNQTEWNRRLTFACEQLGRIVAMNQERVVPRERGHEERR
eukprot:3611038-Prymnesium_polylepis.1